MAVRMANARAAPSPGCIRTARRNRARDVTTAAASAILAAICRPILVFA